MDSRAQVVLDVIQAVQDRDAETLDRLYHDELEFHEAPSLPYGGELKGKDVLQAQLESAPREDLARCLGAAAADRSRAADGPAGDCGPTATRWSSSTRRAA